MKDGFEIRASTLVDHRAIETIYPDAFPNEDLLPLVGDLLKHQHEVLSLFGAVGPSLIGHVIFTKCSVDGCRSHVALLGPLAVATAYQRKGVGSLMVREGLQRLQHDGVSHVLTLGDPAYYGRFGFSSETRITPPYSLPTEWDAAWQSIRLGDVDELVDGRVRLPKPWLRKELWTP